MNREEKSRYGRRTKKRKTNVILNSLIGIVLLLIIIVSANIFLGGDDKKASEQEEPKTEKQENSATDEKKNEEKKSNKDGSKSSETVANSEKETSNDSDHEDKEKPTTSEETDSDENAEKVVTEGGSEPNVIRTIVNPAWKPVGTVQQGEHVNVYDGVDWDEMVEAITYATGLTKENMTIQFLGNNGPNKSVGTVYTKSKDQIYRVYIEWVDGQGWKPSMVEELAAIPEKKKSE